jgi:hypothetical protein
MAHSALWAILYAQTPCLLLTTILNMYLKPMKNNTISVIYRQYIAALSQII